MAHCFSDDKNKILLQDRKEISKHGEEYGFFGGAREGNETPKENLTRELKEELDIEVCKLKDLKFFKKYNVKHYDLDLDVDIDVFLSKMPNFPDLNVKEGKTVIIDFKHAFYLKMIKGDIEILKEVYEHLKKIHQIV